MNRTDSLISILLGQPNPFCLLPCQCDVIRLAFLLITEQAAVCPGLALPTIFIFIFLFAWVFFSLVVFFSNCLLSVILLCEMPKASKGAEALGMMVVVP